MCSCAGFSFCQRMKFGVQKHLQCICLTLSTKLGLVVQNIILFLCYCKKRNNWLKAVLYSLHCHGNSVHSPISHWPELCKLLTNCKIQKQFSQPNCMLCLFLPLAFYLVIFCRSVFYCCHLTFFYLPLHVLGKTVVLPDSRESHETFIPTCSFFSRIRKQRHVEMFPYQLHG